MAYAFANRSAVLLHLGKYEECLLDISQALINGYPTELLYKLEERKAKCNLGLNKVKEAIKACQSVMQLIEQFRMDPIKKNRINKDIHKLLDDAKQKPLTETNEPVNSKEMGNLSAFHLNQFRICQWHIQLLCLIKYLN